MSAAKPQKTRGAPSRRKAEAPAEPAPAETAAVDLGYLPDLLGYALRRAQLAVFKQFKARFEPLEIRPSQFSILVVIANNPAISQTQLSDALYIKRANLVRLLDELEQRHLIRRTVAPTDRRSHALHLTAQGTAFVARMEAVHREFEDGLAEIVGQEGKPLFLKQLYRLIASAGIVEDGAAEDE